MGHMANPPPGECLRDSLRETGWTVSKAARRLGVMRITFSRLLHRHTGVSAEIARARAHRLEQRRVLVALAGQLRFGLCAAQGRSMRA